MAAFTSTQDGDWDDAATWGGGGYPFQGSASDTASVGHTVTITADNATAGTGAVTVTSGGVMHLDADCSAQSFCGAVTVQSGGTLSSNDDTDQKELDVTGTVTISAGGTLDLKKKTTLKFLCGSQAQYGLYCADGHLVYMEGTDTSNRDCVIEGNGSGLETWVVLACNSMATRSSLEWVTLDYVDNYDATYLGGITLKEPNKYGDHTVISGLTISNTSNDGIHLLDGSTTDSWGEIVVSNSGAEYGIHLDGSEVRSGTWVCENGTSGRSLYGIASTIHAGDWTLAATSGNAAYFNYCTVTGGTWDCTATTGYALRPRAGTSICGGTWTAAAAASALYADNWVFQGGEITANSSGTRSIHLFGNCAVYGGVLKSTSTANGYYALRAQLMGCSFCCGTLELSGCQYGVGMYYGFENVVFEHAPAAERYIYIDWSNGDFYNNHVHCVEPRIYIKDTTNKEFNIHFGCYPRNQDDFTTSGTIDWDTTRGSFYVSAGGSVEFPAVQPWQVCEWGTVTATTAGVGASFSWEYNLSNDGGASWGGWTAVPVGGDLSGLAAGGEGQDMMKFRVSVTGATGEVQELDFDGCVYEDADGPATRYWLMPGMTPLWPMPENENYFLEM